MGRLIKISENKPKVIESRAFEREEELQEIVKRFPEIVPLDEIDSEFKPILIIGREFYLKDAGSIDLLGIDASGLITIIEFKLEKNTDIRKVVAQTIEYASNLWGMPYDAFDKSIRQYFNSDRCESDDLKNITLAKAVERHYEKTKTDEEDEFNCEDFITSVSSNLQKGEFRLIIFCDKVDERTKRAVEYLNELSNFDIYCASADFFEADGSQFIKPYLITKDRETISSNKRHAGKISFEEFIDSIPAKFNEFSKIYKEFRERLAETEGFLSMGSKGFGAYFPIKDQKFKPIEGYPHKVYIIAKKTFEAAADLIPIEARKNYEDRIIKFPVFKDSLKQKGKLYGYSFDRMTPQDLKEYFDFVFDWHKKWFTEK